MSASSNVVRLPTAAKRKVEQRFNRHARAERQRLREECPWPGRYIDPQVRAKIPDAAAMLTLDRTPELLLAIALFETLDEDKRRQVRAQCEMLKHTGAAARAANVAVQVRTIGDQVALDAAMTLLRETCCHEC